MRHPFGAFMVATLVFVAPASGEVLIGVAPSLTGLISQTGEIDKQTMEVAVADLNARGGVLGERLRTVLVDDQCDAGAAVLAAGKLVAERVTVVFGHSCSGAAIPASEVYEAAGIPVFSIGSVEPKLTERGQRYVFRLSARSDREAAFVADLMAMRYGDKPIAVVHDTQMASLGLAAYVRSELRLRGLKEVVDAELRPDQVDFSDLIARLRQAQAAVFFCACFSEKAGLLVRQIWESGSRIQALTGNAAGNDTFWALAGAEAAQATLTVQLPDWTRAPIPEMAPLMARLRGAGIDPELFGIHDYAGIQAWAQAAERAKSTRGADVAPVLRKERFDTVLGTIGFDEKGDIVGPFHWVWNRWRDGAYWEVSTEPLLRGEVIEK
jgi:branched-chain amino acid transport system substrate-binding protein